MAEQIRIQKFIAETGAASRRGAERLIREGKVILNGKAVTEMGISIDPTSDHVIVNGKKISSPCKKKHYFALHKPAMVITSKSDPEGRSTVYDLLKGIKIPVLAVGRLDFFTEGLLLFTNDGQFIHGVTHPSFEIEKEYAVLLKGKITEAAIIEWRRGVTLEDGLLKPKRILKMNSFDLGAKQAGTWVQITVLEGRNRIIRRMFEHLELQILRLVRIRVGDIHLEGIKPGKYRRLKDAEVKEIKNTIATVNSKG